MDAIKLRCPCGQNIEVNRNASGQKFRCPSCDILLAVPNVAILPKPVETDETVSVIHLTVRKYRQAILFAVLVFVGGVALGIAGVGIRKIPVQLAGIILALAGFGWLLKVRSLIRRKHQR